MKILAFLIFISGIAQADSFSEKVKIIGFRCQSGKAAVELRSFEQDRILFLADSDFGEPKYLEMSNVHCEGLVRNLHGGLAGKILDVNFKVDRFLRTEQVYIPPRNPCRPGRTKCDDEGYYIEKTFEYERTVTLIEGYRFFGEGIKRP